MGMTRNTKHSPYLIPEERVRRVAQKLAEEGYVLTDEEVRDAIFRVASLLRVIHEELPQVPIEH